MINWLGLGICIVIHVHIVNKLIGDKEIGKDLRLKLIIAVSAIAILPIVSMIVLLDHMTSWTGVVVGIVFIFAWPVFVFLGFNQLVTKYL